MTAKNHTIGESCAYFNKSRQGYYDRIRSEFRQQERQRAVLMQVQKIRHIMPKCGGRKLHYLLNQQGISVGRDNLFTLLRQEGLLVKRKRKYVRTTDSRHSMYKFGNLIKDKEINHAEDVFVSDITYLNTAEGHCYLSIVGDSYSKKILGYHASKDMYAHSVMLGLIMALKNRQYNRLSIHHSDQGKQYGSKSYTEACKLNNILMSMAEKGKAYENPVAERMIGILKDEFGLDQRFINYNHVCKVVPEAIKIYNCDRPHLSCGYLTPEQAHNQAIGLVNKWKKKSYQHINKKKKRSKKRKITTTESVKLI